MSSVRLTLLASLLCLNACVRDAPHTKSDTLDDPRCEGTEEGNSCLTLHVVTNDEVRSHTPRVLKGTLSWGIYKGGDVGLLGPGDHKSIKGDDVHDVDLTGDEAFFDVTVPNVPARPTQVLAYLDTDLDGDSSTGDAVTFPSQPFSVAPNSHVFVTIVLDFIR